MTGTMVEEAITKRYQEEVPGPPSPKDTGRRHTTTRARTRMEEAISKRYHEEGPPSFYCPIGLELMCDPVILVQVRICGRSIARRPRSRPAPYHDAGGSISGPSRRHRRESSCGRSDACGPLSAAVLHSRLTSRASCRALLCRLGTLSRELISRPTWP